MYRMREARCMNLLRTFRQVFFGKGSILFSKLFCKGFRDLPNVSCGFLVGQNPEQGTELATPSLTPFTGEPHEIYCTLFSHVPASD